MKTAINLRAVLVAFCAIGAMAVTSTSFAAANGTDDASVSAYTNGWTTGDDGFITGNAAFGGWYLAWDGGGSFAGVTIESSQNGGTNINTGGTSPPNATNGVAFGMYSEYVPASNTYSHAYRWIDGGLTAGQTFSIDLKVNFRGGYKGIALRDSSDTEIFRFMVGNAGAGDDYQVEIASSGVGSIGSTYSENTIFNMSFTQTDTNGGNWTIIRSGGVVSTNSGTYAGVVTNFYLFADATGGGAWNNLWANNLRIISSCTTVATGGSDNASANAYTNVVNGTTTNNWQNAQNGSISGNAFGQWALNTTYSGTGFVGYEIGDSTTLDGGSGGVNINTSGKSFKLYSTDETNNYVEAIRGFNSGNLQPGQTFSLDIAVNVISNGYKGVDLLGCSLESTSSLFNFNAGGGVFNVDTKAAGTGDGTVFSGSDPTKYFHLIFTQTNSLGGTWQITRSGGGGTASGTYGGQPAGFKLYNGQNGYGATFDFFANNFRIASCASPTYDSWAQRYLFGGGPNALGTADPDGDGMNNTNEFLAGFDPTYGTAYLHITGITRSNTDLNITYRGSNGDTTYCGGPSSRTNVLEVSTGTGSGGYSNNFVSTGLTNILSGGTGVGTVTNFVLTGGVTGPSKYYRVRVLAP